MPRIITYPLTAEPAADDYAALDGLTNGTRRMLLGTIAAQNKNAVAITGGTATLTTLALVPIAWAPNQAGGLTIKDTSNHWVWNLFARSDGAGAARFSIGQDSTETLILTSAGLSVNGDLSSSNSPVYGGGAVLLLGNENSIYTTNTGSPAIYFDHRGTSNTGGFHWRNGTLAANSLMVLNSTGLTVNRTVTVTGTSQSNLIIGGPMGILTIKSTGMPLGLEIGALNGDASSLGYVVNRSGVLHLGGNNAVTIAIDSTGLTVTGGITATGPGWGIFNGGLAVVGAMSNTVAGGQARSMVSSNATGVYERIMVNGVTTGWFGSGDQVFGTSPNDLGLMCATGNARLQGNSVYLNSAATGSVGIQTGGGATSFFYGASSGANSYNAFHDAAAHIWRSQTGTTYGMWSSTSLAVYNALDVSGVLTVANGLNVRENSTFNYEHGRWTRFGIPAASNSGGAVDGYMYIWVSEPGVSWTGGGIARNMRNDSAAFNRVVTTLTGQMIRFTESGEMHFYVENAAGVRAAPLIIGQTNIAIYSTVSMQGGLSVTGAVNSYSSTAGYMCADRFGGPYESIFYRAGGVTRLYDSAGGDVLTYSMYGVTIVHLNNETLSLGRASTDGTVVGFRHGTTFVGSIHLSSTTTYYATSSDARLKTNVRDYTDSGVVIDGIRTRIFDWKTGQTDAVGFLAQELFEVYPAAVCKGDDGEIITDQWKVDFAKLVPVLTAEIKSLRSRVAELEQQHG